MTHHGPRPEPTTGQPPAAGARLLPLAEDATSTPGSVRNRAVLRTRLRGGLVAQVTWEGPRPVLVVQGIRSERTVRALGRAVASWRAFDRYDRVSLDLRRLRHLSPALAEALANDARQAHAAGRRLGFIPPLVAAGPPPCPPVRTQPEEVSPSRGDVSGARGSP